MKFRWLVIYKSYPLGDVRRYSVKIEPSVKFTVSHDIFVFLHSTVGVSYFTLPSGFSCFRSLGDARSLGGRSTENEEHETRVLSSSFS